MEVKENPIFFDLKKKRKLKTNNLQFTERRIGTGRFFNSVRTSKTCYGSVKTRRGSVEIR